MRLRPWRWAWGAVTLAVVAAVCLQASQAAALALEPAVVVAPLVSRAPLLDGRIDGLWFGIPATSIPLWQGRGSTTPAYRVYLRAARTATRLYLLATWRGPAPAARQPGAAGPDVAHNKMILHFSLAAPWPDAEKEMCLTACHTAYVDDGGAARYLVAETIPPGVTDTLDLAGGWQGTRWVFEWSRPLVSGNPFDVQFDDLSGDFTFFVKVIDAVPNLADPVSNDLVLRLSDR